MLGSHGRSRIGGSAAAAGGGFLCAMASREVTVQRVEQLPRASCFDLQPQVADAMATSPCRERDARGLPGVEDALWEATLR